MVLIRPYEPRDLDQAAALYVQVFGEPPWNEEWTVADARTHLEQTIATPGFAALVAVEDEDQRIVGVITGNRKSTSAGDAFLLDDMYIEHVYRGQGLGRRMMDALKLHLGESVSAFALFTHRDTRAAHFYREYGFIEDPHLRFMVKSLIE